MVCRTCLVAAVSSLPLRIPVIIPTVIDHGGLLPVLEALRRQAPCEAWTVVVSQGPQIEALVRHYAERGLVDAHVVLPRNEGLSGAWNRALAGLFEAGREVALLLNDDVILDDARTLTVLRDVYCLPECRRQLRYLKDRGFSAIVISRTIWEEIGAFDEGYWPAYFEDNDYHTRCKRAGIPWDDTQIATSHYLGGSATLRMAPGINAANGTAFPMNRDRYLAKWGGAPGHEIFDRPWGSLEPWPSTRERLPAALRHAIEFPQAVLT